MRHRLALIGLAATLVACAPRGDDTANGGLVNTSWTVLSIPGAPTLLEARATMTFAADGTVSGTGGCNQYSGSFRTDGDRGAFGSMSSTLMGCDDQRGQQEAAFLSNLQGAATWRLVDYGKLVIGETGEIVAGPGVAEGPPGDEPVAALAGTSWRLAEMGGTADFAHLVPTLEFGADGTVSGFAGCNQFHAPVAIRGPDLTLGSLATTKMACARPGSAVESTYLAALLAVKTWRIDESGVLHLDGAVPLTFAPA
jgi:heat shock protein HslJ